MAIITAQAKLYTGIRCWCVDKNISAALSAAFSVGNLDIDFPKDGAVVDVNSNVTWTNPLTSTTYNKVQIYSNIYNWRLRRAVCDMRAVPSISLTDQRYKTYGGGNVSITVSDNGRVVSVSQPDDTQIVYVGNFIGIVPTSSNTGATPPTFDITITDVSNQGKIALTITNPGKNNAQGDTLTFDFEKFYPGSPAGTFACTVSEITAPNTLLKTGGWTAVSTVSCTFPTYIEIDIEKLGIPEGTICTLNFDEGWMLEDRGRRLPSGAWEYPDASQGALSPEQPNYVTFRTPWYGVGRFTSAFSLPNRTGLRIKQLASSVNSSSTISAFGVRNPGRLASLVVSLFSLSGLIGKTTRAVASIISTATIGAITGFVKSFAGDVSANFASNLVSTTSRVRGVLSSISSSFSVLQNSETGRVRFSSMALTSTTQSSVSSIVRFRPGISLMGSSASISLTPIKLVSTSANITAQFGASATAIKPARYVITDFTGFITLNYAGNTNILIDWGDGTSSTHIAASGNSSVSKTYTGGVAERSFTIVGTVSTIRGVSYSPSTGTTRAKLTSFGDLTPTALSNTFSPVQFSQVPTKLPSSVTSLANAFSGSNYTGTEYETWNTINVTNMNSCFLSSPANGNLNLWNVSNVTNIERMFFLSNFNGSLNSWDITKVSSLAEMFAYNSSFNGNISSWNTSNVTNMSSMFESAASFNQPIGSWNTSNVTNMSLMFASAIAFNQPLNSWNTGSVNNMSRMFDNATAFNQSLNSWNVSNVTDMSRMFRQAYVFNQPLNSWTTTNLANTSEMFNSANAFNQPLNSWNMSNATNLSSMFSNAQSFNSSLSGWNLSKATNLSGMFGGNLSVFNQPIGNWTLGKVNNTFQMFASNPVFNQPLNGWGNWMDPIGSTTTCYGMFQNATAFNQPLNSWTTTRMSSAENMFASATAFNGDISSWNTSGLTNAVRMFQNAPVFNSNISSWNVSNVTTMLQMFDGAKAFNQPIGSWNVSNVTNLGNMMTGTTAFNQDLSNWNLYKAPTTGIGPSMSSFFHTSGSFGGVSGMSQENYDRTIIGWANKAKAAEIPLSGFPGKFVGTPRQIGFGRPTAITGSSTTYGTGTFTTGAAAQTYLSGNPIFVAQGAQWTFTGG